MKHGRKKKTQIKPDKAWLSFEKAVAAMQAKMESKTTVTHNEKLIDRSGQARQFDVVIRGKMAGHEILGVIECKDTKRPVALPEIDAFNTKTREANANIKLIASKNGFTKPALAKARDFGIGTISLLPTDPKNTRFSVGFYWYAREFKWDKVEMRLFFKAQKTPIKSFNADEVKRRKCKVLDWFKNELATTYKDEEQEGWHHLKVSFDRPRKFLIGSNFYFLKEIEFRSFLSCKIKRKWVSVNGDGFF